jgi:glucan phosphoethanolaminetransferase (alkaline phosphatase superfamily)
MVDDVQRGLSAKDFHDARAEITNQGVRGLLLINGGAAVALLAFLQAIWSEEPALAKYVVIGIGIFSIGVLLAGFINFFRYHTSFNFQSGNKKLYNLFRRLTYSLQYLSLACFGVGMLVVVSGALCLLK